MRMRLIWVIYLSLILMTLFCVGGCTSFGPATIVEERSQYSEAVNYTSAEQTLANIIRVSHGENPTFLNVGDITSSKNYTANLTGGSSNIGSLLPVGALNSMISANDQPIVKFTPTTGYELIRQVSNPISLTDVYRLNNSNAPLVPLLVISTNRITPKFSDYFRAIALINALDVLGAVVIEQRSAEVISIHFVPEGRLRIVASGNKIDEGGKCFGRSLSSNFAHDLWKQLRSIYAQTNPNEIILSASYIGPRYTPVLTRTAQGALGLSLDDHDIAFLPKSIVDQTIEDNLDQKFCLQDFYFLKSDITIENTWRSYYDMISRTDNIIQQGAFRNIAQRRAIILISVTDVPQSDAFVSFKYRSMWYSIKDSDLISKRNFSLLSTISTIQAVPAAATVPTVNALTLK